MWNLLRFKFDKNNLDEKCCDNCKKNILSLEKVGFS